MLRRDEQTIRAPRSTTPARIGPAQNSFPRMADSSEGESVARAGSNVQRSLNLLLFR